MILFERSENDNFSYKGKLFTREFPKEYFTASLDKEVKGYLEIDIMKEMITVVKADGRDISEGLLRSALSSLLRAGIPEVYIAGTVYLDFITVITGDSIKTQDGEKLLIDIDKFFGKGCSSCS